MQRLEEKNRRNRSRFEISADILEAARAGARKTHIMYRANLSFNMLCRYLDLLTTNGLLNPDTSMDELYRTTEQGLIYLTAFDAYKLTAFDAYKRSECAYVDKVRSLESMLSRSIRDAEKFLSADGLHPVDRF